MLTGLRRVVRAGFVGFWRNAYVSLASVFVLTVALFVIGATMFLDQLLGHSLSILQSKVDINVYFVPDAPQEEIQRLQTAIEALPDVAEVSLTTREEVLAEYRDRNRDNELSLQAIDALDENPLGATIAVRAEETSRYESIARFIEEQRENEDPQTPIIEDVNYENNRESIERLTMIIDATERASFIVMGILLIAAVLITFNTIRLAIYTAREEIAIMRLVGASNMFIRGPFMLQGVMYGFMAGLLATMMFYPMLAWLGPRTQEFFELNLFTYYLSNFGTIFGILVGIGVILGFLSSTIAVARYLRT